MLHQPRHPICRKWDEWRCQKKSPELSSKPPATSPKPEEPNKNTPPESKQPPNEVDTAKEVITATPKPLPKVTKPLVGSPSIGSITSLMNEVEQEVADDNASTSEISQEDLEAAWKAYMDQHIKQKSVLATFKTTKLQLEADKITVTVPSQFAQGNIKGESELMPFLRQQLKHNRLVFDFKIDLSLKPKIEKPKIPKLLSDRDKYRLMREKNPLIDQLVKRFEMGLDSR